MSFYKKSNSANEIEKSFADLMPEEKTQENSKFDEALQLLATAATLFEELKLEEEAEITTQFLETIADGRFEMVKEAKRKAKKKSKKKKKSKSKSKNKLTTRLLKHKNEPATIEVVQEKFDDELTPEKQLENLENIGWVFNAPKDCSDCSMVDDGPKEDEVPADYEACGDCGFDHSYESQEAFNAHFPKIEEAGEEEKDDNLAVY